MFTPTDTDTFALFFNSPVPIAFMDPAGKFLRVNLQWSEFTGYTLLELEDGVTFKDLTHPGDLSGDIDALNLFKTDVQLKNYNYTKRYITKNGKIKWAQLHLQAVRQDNNLVYFIATVIPLPNGGNFKIEKIQDTIQIRPTIHIMDFIKDNWKWVAGIIVAIGLFIFKLISVMAVVLDKLGISW